MTRLTTSLPCRPIAFAKLGAEILRGGKFLRFRARTASMQPQVWDGDCLLVQPVAVGTIRVGDIVLRSTRWIP